MISSSTDHWISLYRVCILRVTNLDVDGDPDAHGDKITMVEFVTVLGTFAVGSTFFRDVRVVLGGTNFNIDRDRDVHGFVAVLGTSAFIGTFSGV